MINNQLPVSKGNATNNHAPASERIPASQRILNALNEAAAKLEAVERSRHEAIAIMGMGCRFPGQANNPAQFWENLKNGLDSQSEIPASRWSLDQWYDEDAKKKGKMVARHACLLESIAQFDPQFFGISPREAMLMDPQQRLLLEVTWEALETANVVPETLKNSRTGIYVGCMTQDYAMLSCQPEQVDVHTGTGNATSVLAGRLAYFLGCHGPAMTIDTACSSSLVAVHQALQSLRSNEIDMAIVAGVNLILAPHMSLVESKAQMLSRQGHCKTFDEGADGYVRGEGCGVIILQRQSAAQHQGHHIEALIRGSAVNHDGRSSGLTVPSGPAQQAVIKQALANAKIEANAVGYIEAHGTGTPLGDPIEIGALGQVFGTGRQHSQPLIIGSVKTNIGHLEGAAGIAGIIKVVLSLKHNEIPAHLHFEHPNAHIPWQSLPFLIPRECKAWHTEKPKIAGVSSFGFSGTNAHIIIEQAPPEVINPQQRTHQLLTLSAKDSVALNQLVMQYQQRFTAATSTATTAALVANANLGRSHFRHRCAVVGTDHADFGHKLKAWQEQDVAVADIEQQFPPDNALRVGFVFSGQGAQYSGMGQDLYQAEPVFKAAIDECDQHLQGRLDCSLIDLLYPQPPQHPENEDPLNQTCYTQPALFALEYALARLWQSWGIQPHVVMGHSVGEYVAACLAGMMTLADALILIAERGRLIQALPENGAMCVIHAAADRVRPFLSEYGHAVTIAAINSQENTVISGDAETMSHIVDAIKLAGIDHQYLNVSHAFHSPLMEPILAEFKQFADKMDYQDSTITFISNLIGDKTHRMNAVYWTDHIRQPVQFSAGLQVMAAAVDVIIEIGPKATLLGLIRKRLNGKAPLLLSSLHPKQADCQHLLSSLAQCYRLGAEVDWSAFQQPFSQPYVALPTYPFQRQTYWLPEQETQSPVTQSPPTIDQSAAVKISDLDNQESWLNQLDSLSEADAALFLNQVQEKRLAAVRHRLQQLSPIKQQLYQCYNQIHSDSDLAIETVGGGVVHDYYNALSKADTALTFSVQSENHERYLTFGPLADIVPEFSWIMTQAYPEKYPEMMTMATQAQKEMRALLFEKIDFEQCHQVQDIGCGYGSDLVSLAKANPHLNCYGYTISSDQANIGNEIAAKNKLQDRLTIFNRDSAKDDFPAQMDLIFGFEVVHHIRDKNRLFQNIGAHLKDEGYLVMADFISNADFAIDHDTTSSFFIQKPEWVALLASQQLAIVDFIDISDAVSNFLHDPDFEGHLAEILGDHPDENVKQALISYNQLGKLFRKGLASYVLIITQKQVAKTEALLREINASKLAVADHYIQRSIPHWFYQTQWQAETQNEAITQGQPEIWLIFSDDKKAATAITDQVRKASQKAIWVQSGQDYQYLNDQYCIIDYHQVAQFEQLFSDIRIQLHDPAIGCVYLPENQPDALTEHQLCAYQEKQVSGWLHLLQAITANEHPKTPCCWLITRQAAASQMPLPLAEPIQYAQASLWGLALSYLREQPALCCQWIDSDAAGIPYLVNTMITTTEERNLIRNGQRYVQRLQRQPAVTPEQPIMVSPQGGYLITGGLGALGLKTAAWLVQKGAGRLVLTSRHQANEKAKAIIAPWQQLGVVVDVITADMASRESVANLFSAMNAGQHPLKGIIHAAGVLADGLIAQQTWSTFETVFAAKVYGSWHLHQQTVNLKLDFFICYSSMASVLGSPGQANYSAANAFMDTLMQQRQQLGLPGISLNWGLWDNEGMIAGMAEQDRQRMQKQGISLIRAEQGIAALDVVNPQQQVMIAPLNWSQFNQQRQHQPWPLITAFQQHPVASVALEQNMVAQLEHLPQFKRKSALLVAIKQQVATILALPDPASIDPKQGFFDMGMDSLTAVELRDVLQKQCQCQLPATLTFKCPTVQALSDYLITEKMPHLFEQNALDLVVNPKPEVVPETADIAVMLDDKIAALDAWIEDME